MQYIPVLILDEDETPNHDSMTLKSFLEIIDFHINNRGVKPEEVFVKISTENYKDDAGFDIPLGQIEFFEKRDG